jgi:long-chain acyl-CoA synthetase
VDHAVFHWALALAERFDVSHPPKGLAALQWQLAQRLVLHHWRSIFGDRLQALICGGAPLRAELVQVFTAAGSQYCRGMA